MNNTSRLSVTDLVGHWLISAVAVLLTAYVLPGVAVSGFMAALAAAVVLGIINAVIRPLAIILTLPLTIVTLGLFALVINAVLVLLAAAVVPGFAVASFWWALAFSLVLSLVNAALYSLRT